MAAAARIRVTQKISTAFRPAISAVEELSSVGWNWDNCDRASEPVLDAQILFIPDYQIDQGEGFLLDYQDKSRLSRLLNYRRKHGLKTWVGIQNPHKLTEEEKKLILGNYVIRDLSPVSQTSLPEPESIIPKWSPQFYDIPNGTWNLRGLATLEGLGYLFKA